MHTKIIQDLLTTVNQLKIYHWQTCSYAKHKALGEAYNDLSDLVDRFVEILLGKYGKECLTTMNFTLFSEKEVCVCDALAEISTYLINLSSELNCECDSDLLNIRDEMLAVINHTKYLFSLQ